MRRTVTVNSNCNCYRKPNRCQQLNGQTLNVAALIIARTVLVIFKHFAILCASSDHQRQEVRMVCEADRLCAERIGHLRAQHEFLLGLRQLVAARLSDDFEQSTMLLIHRFVVQLFALVRIHTWQPASRSPPQLPAADAT